ncbi:hypothetical protein [Pseudonocardia phyllosphaerae]|uniref:hypothetical protein n=1 Tax=Pseudonocardia phyllosphaerae TaxID=3390502 RepID=UPI00397A0BAB
MRRFLITVAVLLVLFAIITAPQQSAASVGRVGNGLSSAAHSAGEFVFTLFGRSGSSERSRPTTTRQEPTTTYAPGDRFNEK